MKSKEGPGEAKSFFAFLFGTPSYSDLRRSPTRVGLLNWILAFDNTNEEKDNRKNEQDVDKSTEHMETDKPDKPENEQDNCNCGKHKIIYPTVTL